MASRSILRNYQGVFLLAFRMLDLGLLVLAALLAYGFAGPSLPVDGAWKAVVLLSLLLFTVVADAMRLYQPWRGRQLHHELTRVMTVAMLTVGGIALAVELLGLLSAEVHGPKLYGSWLLGALVLIVALRLVVRPALMSLRRHGINQRRVLIVGMSETMAAYLDELTQHPEFGFLFEGYVDDRSGIRGNAGYKPPVPRLGSTGELDQLVARRGIDQVWVAYPVSASERILRVMHSLRHQPVALRQIMDLESHPEHGSSITSILNRPVLDIDVTLTDGALGLFVKSLQDKILAAAILAITSPVLVAIAIAVKLSSPGPVFYRQTRLTWRNKPFEMIKFRTMPVDVEKQTGPRWARPGENRATRVGAFLRATSLDELPQFWNVLRGDMSIVGPRPERPEFVEQFKDEIPNYMKKHRVKAGITGWAQVNGFRGATDLAKRIEYDLQYIRNSSLPFDLYIILLTLLKGFVHKNAY